MTAVDATLDDADLLLVGATDWLDRFADGLATETDATVHRRDGVDGALQFVDGRSPACIVTALSLPNAPAVDLIEYLRSETAAPPVVVATDSGDEETASGLLGAGATDYVAIGDDVDAAIEDLSARTERAVSAARSRRTRRERARQFDAMFDDDRTATWVLAPDGHLARLNEAARGMLESPTDDLLGEPFWTLPWWSDSEEPNDDVRRLVETALDGSFANAVVARSSLTDDSTVVDLSVRPVSNDRDELVSVVVEGVDVTDRIDLERDLRRSEELHRVTLNNMTDTVLMTDEDGEYTYVCPNVHFIFGYTAEELRDRVPIDELLGDPLFDRDELAADGVLKNIEVTATDKAGNEHTLLVNVREVSIQDGTLLYSCRDITKRKQREEALATLQETARDFLYAQTHQEIAQHVVDDTPGVLDLDASAVFLFDPDSNQLRPSAYSAALSELHGPLPDVPVSEDTLPAFSFVEDEALFFDDVHRSARLANEATDIRSAAFIPLGDHGVFLVGSDSVDAFDDVTRELTDLLAATAEAALDRVTRESRLREQDRTLQRKNDQLTALNRINETIREIDQALVQAETRDAVDHTVCELLTDDDRFAFAWVGTVDRATGTVTPRAWDGAEQGYLDSRTFTVDETGGEPVGRTAAAGETTTVSNVAAGLRDEPWRTDALARDYLSVLSIPLVYNDLTHGVLTVYADSRAAFDDTARAVLSELGETIASALSALERKNALLSTSMTRVEFDIADDAFVLSRLARAADCTISYRGGVQQTTEGSFVFARFEDASVSAVVEAADDLVAIEGVQTVSDDGASGVVRLRLSQPFLALELADHGAVFREATTTPETTTLVVDVPNGIDVRTVTQLVRETFSGVELRSRQTLENVDERDLYATFLDEVTDRQLEVAQTAYFSGFFESPRDSSGQAVAETLDISSTAFYRHVRTVERKLFAMLFEEGTRPPRPGGVR
ncbi:bacterio-opsin activator domain-containing protein [Haloarchaeobius salinus]|uniref:bacterio-opsin activator domain-containing protein n=1 Tax=Haloarchaeobius salinus TaxID=1198298 RepID=UPI002108C3A5|nr:bacterio-opsin activator domain-containing protein [Haloarchaeobius salinus]